MITTGREWRADEPIQIIVNRGHGVPQNDGSNWSNTDWPQRIGVTFIYRKMIKTEGIQKRHDH